MKTNKTSIKCNHVKVTVVFPSLPFQCPGRIGSFRTTTFSSDDLVPHFRGAATQPELAGPYKNKTPQNNTPVLVTSEISSVP